MFSLFKKKKEEPKPAAAEHTEKQEKNQEYRAFAEAFLPEETTILAVTGLGFGSERVGDTGMWKFTFELTAWMDKYTQELQQGGARLEAMVDEKLLEYLNSHVPRNFIIEVPVRPSEDGRRFMMTDLPKPAFDPDLKAILEEQKKPVTCEVEGVGTFTLSRAMGWFEAAVDWMGGEVSLTFDQAEETMDSAQETARALMNAQQEWDDRVRAFAADRLLDQVNELLAEDEDAQPLTGEDLLAQLEPDSILAGPNGAFEFWFSGDDLFLAHPVHVTGNLEEGPVQAELDA